MAIINVSAGNSILVSGAPHREGYDASLGIAGDALLFDGARAIQYVQAGAKTITKGKIAEAVPTSYTIPHALRRQVSIRQAQLSGGKLRTSDGYWEIPVLELPITPREGDFIHVAANRWQVIACDEATHSTRWRVYARLV